MMSESDRTPTIVRHSGWFHVMLWTALPILGGIVGGVASRLPGWIAQLPWFPNQAKIAELSEVVGVKTTVSLIVAGVIVGIVLAMMAYDEMVTVTVSADRIAIERANTPPIELAGHDVTGVFTENKALITLGTSGTELAREPIDLPISRLEDAFRAHGYVWHDHDPYADNFTRWVDGATALSRDAHALLRARHDELENDGDAADLRELRHYLAELGVIVKERNKKQYWRSA